MTAEQDRALAHIAARAILAEEAADGAAVEIEYGAPFQVPSKKKCAEMEKLRAAFLKRKRKRERKK